LESERKSKKWKKRENKKFPYKSRVKTVEEDINFSKKVHENPSK